MKTNRTEIIKMAEDFLAKAKAENLWFSLDNMTLLGAKRHGGFVPWNEKFEVMLDVDSYNNLKKSYPNNVIDSSIDKSFKSLTAAWVKDNKNWQQEQPFLQIRILVPTTIEKLKKFKSKFGYIRRFFKFEKDSIKHAINDLYDQKMHQGFIVMQSRKSDTEKTWIQVVTFDQEEVNFGNSKFPVLKEYETVLENWFGKDYMNAEVPTSWYEYPAPLIIRKAS